MASIDFKRLLAKVGDAKFTDVVINGASINKAVSVNGKMSASGSGSGFYGGNGASVTSGGAALGSNPTVFYQNRTMSLQDFVNSLAEEVVTKKITANFIISALASIRTLKVSYLDVSQGIRIGNSGTFRESDVDWVRSQH